MKHLKNVFNYTLLISLVLFLSFSLFDDKDDIEKYRDNNITDDEIYQHIKYLASDELEGRFPGTNGDKLAQDYIAKEYKVYGLQPAGDNDSYIQNFNIITKLQLGEKSNLEITTNGDKKTFEVEKDFIPLGFTENGIAEGDLVFVGYGITAPELNYDDFKDKDGNDIDVSGKILVMLRYSPGYNDSDDNNFFKYENIRFKTINPRDENAAGIILITGPESNKEDNLIELRYDKISQNSGIPIINAKREIIEKIFQSNGLDLAEIQKGIDESKSPNSFALKNSNAKFETSVELVDVTTGNVVGMLEGSDPVLKNEVIVVGGHYDHLGYGQYGSLYSGEDKQIHNGADDNASGTVGVLELAQKLASNKENLKRSVLFICFGGEEAGLLGSAYFVNSELFKKLNIVSMINMDMIGRLADDKLIIYGTGTSPFWEPEITELNKTYKFDITSNAAGFGASDHTSFYQKGIPVLHFFTGLHSEYHRPIDDYDKINSKGEEKVLNLIYDLTTDVLTKETRPKFAKVETTDDANKRTGDIRVYVGTIPDFSSKSDGYKISGVKSGGPAETGGLLGGDVIIKFGSKDIKNIYDFTYALKMYKPDDIVDVIVMRGDEKLIFKVVLGRK
ncbi:M20/M25/M40 family metallo-hydrolase [Bacteroidota bacterium]